MWHDRKARYLAAKESEKQAEIQELQTIKETDQARAEAFLTEGAAGR